MQDMAEANQEHCENHFIIEGILCIIDTDGTLWFKANDVVEALNCPSPRSFIKDKVSEEDKRNLSVISKVCQCGLNVPGQTQFINSRSFVKICNQVKPADVFCFTTAPVEKDKENENKNVIYYIAYDADFKRRLVSINATRPETDEYRLVRKERSDHARYLKKLIHKYLAPFRMTDRNELFECPEAEMNEAFDTCSQRVREFEDAIQNLSEWAESGQLFLRSVSLLEAFIEAVAEIENQI